MQTVLEGLKVLDFSRVFAGPAATQVLGDLGADVIKVEPPGGDEARAFGVTREQREHLGESSPSFIALNRNKRSIVLDLRNKEGLAVARRLAAKSDVIVHNYRPGVMERLGLDYDACAALNPRVIFAEFSAYGREGPLATAGANDVALQAYSGLMNMTGEPERPPVRCGTAVVDLHGSLALVGGILAALIHRTRTGQGQRVEASLLLSAAHLMSYFYTEYWLDGTQQQRMGTANHLTVPNQTFPTLDGDVVVIASTDETWDRLAQALDPSRLAIPEFAHVFDRMSHREKLIETLSAVTGAMTSAEVVDRLLRAKVVAAKVNSVGEAADSPQLEAIGGRVLLAIGDRTVASVSSPFQLGGVDMSRVNAPPAPGAHRDDVLGQFGFGPEEIARLQAEGAFGASRTSHLDRKVAGT